VNANLYDGLIASPDDHQAVCRLIDHAPEGRTEIVGAMRDHDMKHAAKCAISVTKLGKNTTKYVFAVIPGNRRLRFPAIKSILGARYVAFAGLDVGERLGAPE
jgi:Ala-tRNA(Pro) deacylase